MVDDIVEEINLKLSKLGFNDPSLLVSSSSLTNEGVSEKDLEILSWLNDAIETVIEDGNIQSESDRPNDNNEIDFYGDDDGDDDDDYESCEMETILEERLQQLSLQYEALSKTEMPPVRMSEDKYRRSRKEKSLQCQEAARGFEEAVHNFLGVIKEFRPTDMNDKHINEYFAREEEFTRCVREWVRSKLGDMPHKREDDLESRQTTIRLLNSTLSSTERKALELEIKASLTQPAEADVSDEEITAVKGEIENLTGNVIPVLCEGYELLETLPAVVADCEEEIEEMAYSAAVLEQGISLMMEQLARCFLFELLLEEKALRGDMQVSILTHVMEKELLTAKMEYEQWKVVNTRKSHKKRYDHAANENVSGEEFAPDVDHEGAISGVIQDKAGYNNTLNKESISSYGRLRPWVKKLEGMLFDESGKLCVKQDDLEGILSEAETKTKELNDLVAQLERDYHAEKDSLKCDRIRSFERNLWIDFFATPEKLKEVVREAQKSLLD